MFPKTPSCFDRRTAIEVLSRCYRKEGT
jgi:hypothetical protein